MMGSPAVTLSPPRLSPQAGIAGLRGRLARLQAEGRHEQSPWVPAAMGHASLGAVAALPSLLQNN